MLLLVTISTKFIAYKCVEALKLLSKLENVAIIDPQVAFNLLHVCGSFCAVAYIAWSTPPSLSSSLSVASPDQACTTSGVLCGAPKAPRQDEAVQFLFGCPFFFNEQCHDGTGGII